MHEPPATASIRRAYYSAPIAEFLKSPASTVLDELTRWSDFSIELTQRAAWEAEVSFLKELLPPYAGRGGIALEYVLPRLGRRIDAVVLIDCALFVLEFKVGEEGFNRAAREQAWDYALDLKNFHDKSHSLCIAPILIATEASARKSGPDFVAGHDQVLAPLELAPHQVGEAIDAVLRTYPRGATDWGDWQMGQYRPTPTIIEAARALYARHSVADLSRADASARNLKRTSVAISDLIRQCRDRKEKALCFVTGVPGAGKTLVGLDIATKHMDASSELHSVYLSGNGPLVTILREALTRDKVTRESLRGKKLRKGEARQSVEMFIQNVHHFRDDCLKDERPPIEHVAIFDEAQRAWTRDKTVDFMRRKKKRADFNVSEPEFLISCLERHKDWAVVVCLVGGGQEINTGEAGISEWIDATLRSFKDWHVYVSPQLHDNEYGAGRVLEDLAGRAHVHLDDDLHLSVSMRSFRAEHVSNFVKKVLDLEAAQAAAEYQRFAARYPIRLTRDLSKAKRWLREQARGSERYGIVVSSQAQRLKPYAIDVRSPMDPVHWFLDDKTDTRSSFYLEDVATEFDVQGLELDWACVVWDADFRYGAKGWQHHSFVGDRWININKEERRRYLKNAYRVLLTRARQGMVIVVPEGSEEDHTRASSYYDSTYNYLCSLGLPLV